MLRITSGTQCTRVLGYLYERRTICDGQTSVPKKLYTWAINAVCDEMEGLGVSVHCNNVREEHTNIAVIAINA